MDLYGPYKSNDWSVQFIGECGTNMRNLLNPNIYHTLWTIQFLLN